MKKIVIILATVALVIVTALITYNIFSFFNDNEQIEQFEAELNEIISRQDREFETDDLSKQFNSVETSYQYDSDRVVNPFVSTLVARKKADSLINGLNRIEVEQKRIESQPEESVDISTKINLKGTLTTNRGNLAIVDLISSGQTEIIRTGDRIYDFKTYRISSEQIIFSKDGEYFIYSFGGEDN